MSAQVITDVDDTWRWGECRRSSLVGVFVPHGILQVSPIKWWLSVPKHIPLPSPAVKARTHLIFNNKGGVGAEE